MEGEGVYGKVYRGTREGSLDEESGWYTLDEAYARKYGAKVISRNVALAPEQIIELRPLTLADDRCITGQDLEAASPGLSKLFGLQLDEPVRADELWERASGDTQDILDYLEKTGNQALAWYEDGGNEAFLLRL